MTVTSRLKKKWQAWFANELELFHLVPGSSFYILIWQMLCSTLLSLLSLTLANKKQRIMVLILFASFLQEFMLCVEVFNIRYSEKKNEIVLNSFVSARIRLYLFRYTGNWEVIGFWFLFILVSNESKLSGFNLCLSNGRWIEGIVLRDL